MLSLSSKPLDFFRPDPTQPRKSFDPEELRLLRDSLVKKQLVPLICRPCGTIIDGERRWRAAMLDGKPAHLDTIILEGNATEAEVKQIQLVTALHRADLTPYEVYLGLLQLKTKLLGVTDKELAEKISRSPTTVSEIMSLERCPAEVKSAAEKGLVGPSDWSVMARAADPVALLHAKLNGASRADIRNATRQGTNGEADTKKVDRIKCEVPGKDATLTISGKSLSLVQAVSVVHAWLKLASDAIKQGQSASTFVRHCKDLVSKESEKKAGTSEHEEVA